MDGAGHCALKAEERTAPVADWIGENLWALWLTLAVALAVVEVLVLDLIFLMLAAGSAAALATALAGGDPWLQIGVFAAVSLLMLVVVRPTALKHLRKGTPDQLTNADALPGRTVEVLEDTTATTGLVKVDGEVWTARAPEGQTIPAGSSAQIDQVDGATLRVQARPEIDWDAGRTA